MAATASPPFDRAALGRFLAAAGEAERVEVTEPALLAGGAIRENWGFEAVFAGGPLAGRQALVLRTDAPTGIAASLGRVEEFAVLRAAWAAGVAVPEPLFACTDPAVIGRPFFVMRLLAGTAQGRDITADPALEPILPDLAARLGRELALIQTIRSPRPDLAFLPDVDAPAHIAGFRAYLNGHAQKRPVLEWAIRWLDKHLPETLPPVLCHRDFRTGNYMVAPSLPSPARGGGSGWGLTGILDWEFAGWGDPDEDIGWFCCKGWRFARLDREAGGIADRAAFYEGYESAAGRRLDPARVRFWEVLANIRWAVIALQQADRVLLGGARDLATAIIGRRAAECELELLMLLDDDPHPSLPRKRGRVRVGVAGGTPSVRNPAREQPSGAALAALGGDWLIGELLPMVPAEHHRELRLLATAIGIAEREAAAGDAPIREIEERLAAFYRCGGDGASGTGPHPDPPPQAGEGRVGASPPGPLFSRFARDLRAGAFEACGVRARAARAILWRITIMKLREGNPSFLAANGFGE